jgi:sugar phosphate isomerase/epimerase
MPDSVSAAKSRIGVVTEALVEKPLPQVMDWLLEAAPQVTDLEIGTGGYAPSNHCDLHMLLRDTDARRRWLTEITSRGLRIGALNAWGNPLHPDESIGSRHAADLYDTVRLASELGVDRIVALAGCPAAAAADRVPNFAAGGWLPYLEDAYRAQWEERVIPFWSAAAEHARRENPDLLICVELHPGTVVYNVETFEQFAGLGPSLAANVDPSHFFWMGMDAKAVVRRLRDRVGHCHAKDVAFSSENLALNGLLDRRWPKPAADMPWNFAVVGRGRNPAWWHSFIAELLAHGRVKTIAVEHEDPFVAPEIGIPEAAEVIATAASEPR